MPDFGRWTSNGGDPSLNEINRTDRFLDSLAFEQPVYATDPGEAELANLLAGWRDEVRDTPLTVAMTPRDAVAAFDDARASRKRGRTLAVVGSAAAAVLCLGGFVSVVAGAGPGDSLYGLRTMIFGEQQPTRDDAVMLASQQLAEVQQLIDDGQWEAAQNKLQTLTTTVATVNDVEQKEQLVTQWQQLTVKVEQQDANAVPEPGAPLPQMPDVPVVVAPGSDTSTTTSSDTSTTSTEPSTTSTTSPSTSTSTSTSPSEAPSEAPVTTTTSAETTSTSTHTTTTSPVQQLPVTTTVTTSVAAPPIAAHVPSPSEPMPTPSAKVVLPTPQPTPSAVVEQPAEKPAPHEEPATQEAPKSVVTTTSMVPVVPEPAHGGDGPN
jgi:hypothetical protein